ncbi:GspH/FimT family pseudopilin [Pseudomonas citronellolis]|uniref:GspH/FimT family pseudopilin n=1 Tax=Pseudomonas citronellolis TaxID=53408 RepID=UPI0023E3937A|nr:GspH/FimT family pseudopilin [Pseudomonas citronellolis]MDF3931080.1 GspH/FimT family pseudopilin [Pseudomonas citronellolis]
MTRSRGFTLPEALVALTVLLIGLNLAIPAFANLIAAQYASSALHSLRAALNHTRETAALGGRPTSLIARDGDWAKGWTLIHDDNNDGQRQPGETLLREHAALPRVRIQADRTSRDYIHYRPDGHSVQPNGAFHAGHLAICSNHATGHRILINRSGRIRTESAPSATLCPP